MLGRQPVFRDALTEHDEGRLPDIDGDEDPQSQTESCSGRGVLRYADFRLPTTRKQVTQEDDFDADFFNRDVTATAGLRRCTDRKQRRLHPRD